jgi:hypothetical protein
VKPLPPGLHVQSNTVRLAESDLELLDGTRGRAAILERSLALIAQAEQLIVVDASPLPREVAQALLLRKSARPHLKVVVLTDPKIGSRDAYSQDLFSLERAGVIVARVKLAQLRDPNVLYSGAWRLGVAWWNDLLFLRFTHKTDARRLLVADDGSGGWDTLLSCADALALVVRGGGAEQILGSELSIARWSSDDERLPAAPPPKDRGVGTVDVRHLTEGALGLAAKEAIETTRSTDVIELSAHVLTQRALIDALKAAAARKVLVRILLDIEDPPNSAVAAELERAGVELRWSAQGAPTAAFLFIRRGADSAAWLSSADFTRRNLDDFNLANAIEVKLSSRASLSINLEQYFLTRFSHGAAYGMNARESTPRDIAYRLGEALGSADF